jgi:hypothetical protein
MQKSFMRPQPSSKYYTTGLSTSKILDLVTMLNPHLPRKTSWQGRLQALGPYKQVIVTLTYLRRNRTQLELAEEHGVSQATISRCLSRITSLIAELLIDWIPAADELDTRSTLLVDGTLVPTWSWKTHPEDYSGKHHTTGLNLQVACTMNGDLAWVSDPLPGKTHDAEAIRRHGYLDKPANAALDIADKGCQGLKMITPIKKHPHQEKLSATDKEYNKQINTLRAPVERCIANLKTWRILHTDYRHPHHTHPETITAIIGLEFFKLSY